LDSPTTAARGGHVANLKRRLYALERHNQARDPVTGKSQIAVAGGQAAARVNVERDPGGPSAFGLRLALRRWHPELLEESGSGGAT
jgi:hypothetical protein